MKKSYEVAYSYSSIPCQITMLCLTSDSQTINKLQVVDDTFHFPPITAGMETQTQSCWDTPLAHPQHKARCQHTY